MTIETKNSSTAITWIGSALVLMLLSRWLEQSLTANLLIGYPALVVFGYFLGQRALQQPHIEAVVARTGGIPWLLLATFTLAFWMIPRWMDASVAHLDIALLKYLSLIFPVGVALGCGWRYLHYISRAVIKIELLTMLFRLGWLYLISPDRLCNNYLLSDQVMLGKALLVIGLLMTLVFCFPLFFTRGYEQNTRDCPVVEEYGS